MNLFPKNGIPIGVCLQDFELNHEGELKTRKTWRFTIYSKTYLSREETRVNQS